MDECWLGLGCEGPWYESVYGARGARRGSSHLVSHGLVCLESGARPRSSRAFARRIARDLGNRLTFEPWPVAILDRTGTERVDLRTVKAGRSLSGQATPQDRLAPWRSRRQYGPQPRSSRQPSTSSGPGDTATSSGSQPSADEPTRNAQTVRHFRAGSSGAVIVPRRHEPGLRGGHPLRRRGGPCPHCAAPATIGRLTKPRSLVRVDQGNAPEMTVEHQLGAIPTNRGVSVFPTDHSLVGAWSGRREAPGLCGCVSPTGLVSSHPPSTVHAVLPHTAHRRPSPPAFSVPVATAGWAAARRWFRRG